MKFDKYLLNSVVALTLLHFQLWGIVWYAGGSGSQSPPIYFVNGKASAEHRIYSKWDKFIFAEKNRGWLYAVLGCDVAAVLLGLFFVRKSYVPPGHFFSILPAGLVNCRESENYHIERRSHAKPVKPLGIGH